MICVNEVNIEQFDEELEYSRGQEGMQYKPILINWSGSWGFGRRMSTAIVFCDCQSFEHNKI
jgi:hypothetical protein